MKHAASKLMSRVSLCVLGGLGISGQATAQSAAANPEASSVDVEQGIPDIVITAQRREERLQDVPIAVSVIGGRIGTLRGLDDTESLQNAVAGLNFTRLGSFATPFIRGVGTNAIAQGDENSVAIYIDGVYQLSPNSGVFSLNNIERTEVLKGPQGTLFGRNANGGVINVITRMPSDEPSLEASAGVGNYQTVEASFYATGAIASGLTADISVYGRNQADGWGKNINDGTDIFEGYEVTARTKWRWIPSDATEVVISGGYAKARDDSLSFRPARGELGADGVTTFPGFYNVNLDMGAYNLLEAWDASAHISQDFGWATLKSITAYQHINTTRPSDNDATPAAIQNVIAVDQYDHAFTQELQLQSSSGPLQWIAGLFYLNGESGYRRPDGITIVGSSNGDLAFVKVFGDQKIKSYAGYAQATYSVTDATRITLGGRYTRDKRSIIGNVELPPPLGALPSSQQKAHYSRFTYRVSLDHHFSDGIMAYATHSTGFKGGLFNNTAAGDPAARPEKLKAYEIGLKTTLLDRRLLLNGSAFLYDYKDIQANVYTGSSSGLIGLLNAAKARIKGIDMDLTAAPVKGLTVQAGLSYLDPEYRSFPGAPIYLPNPDGGRTPIPGDAAGNQMIKTSKWQYNIGSQLEIPAGDGRVILAGNYSYRSSFYWEFSNAFKEDAQHMLAGSITWAPTERYSVKIWGKNLLDNHYVSNGLALTSGFLESPGAPRTFGATLSVTIN